MLIIGDVNFFIFFFKDSHQGGELFFRRAGEAPVDERVVGILFEHIPGDKTAGINKVGFKIGVFGHFFVIEGRGGKDIEVFQATALQQLGDGTFQGDAEVRMCAERGEAGSVRRVKQHHADNRIFAAQRAIVSKNRETFGFQLIDGLHHTRITRHDLCRNFWQADALRDDAVFNMTLEDFRQRLNARFVRRVAR